MKEKRIPKTNPTLVRVVACWSVTVSLFCVYNFLIAPLIESPIRVRSEGKTEVQKAEYESPYARFFPPDAWESRTDQGNFLKSDNIIMLFQNLKFDEEARAIGDMCTILVAPGEDVFPLRDPPGKPFHPLKISILGGVEIQFDSAGDLTKAHPLGGKLNGPVTMNYKAEIKGQLVDCSVVTSDLFCDMQSVQTQKSVNFRIGPLEGSGNQLNILFSSDLGQKTFTGVQSVRLEHLTQITLHVTPMLLQGMNLKMSPEMQQRMMKMFTSRMEIPVTLKCDGPMLYDVANGTVTFFQNVVLECEYAELSHDSLTCGELVLNLSSRLRDQLQMKDLEETERAEIEESMENQNGDEIALFADKEGLLLESIFARQNILLNFPTFDCRAAGETLEFHLGNRTIQLSGSQQTEISSGGHEFHANSILYTLPPAGKQLGNVYVNGNGWFRTILQVPQGSDGTTESAAVPFQKEVPLVMNWRQELSAQNGTNGAYSFHASGSVELNCDLYGNLKADSLSAGIRPKTSDEIRTENQLAVQLGVDLKNGQKTSSSGASASAGSGGESGTLENYVLQSLTAQGNVNLNIVQESGELHAELNEILLDFQQASEVPEGVAASRARSSAAAGRNGDANGAGFGRKNSSASGRDGNFRTSSGPQSEKPTSSVPYRFVLQAGTLSGKILLLPGKESFYISEMALVGAQDKNLVLRENIPFAPSEYAIALQARSVTLHEVRPETLQCEILGGPALLGGRGVWLESPQIAVNCAANRIDINNAGTLRLYTRTKTDSQLNYSTLTETKVTWAGSMVFNGELLTVLNNVEIKAPFTNFRAEKICAELAEKIYLSDPPKLQEGEKMDAETVSNFFNDISAEQNVVLRREMHDRSNRLTGVLCVETQLASFQPASMILNVVNRGTLRFTVLEETMHRKKDPQQGTTETAETSQTSEVSQTPQTSKIESESSEDSKKMEWYQVFLEYYGGIRGNLLDGEFQMDRNISAIGFPVPTPEYKISTIRVEPRAIPANGFQFGCDHITLNQTPLAANGLLRSSSTDTLNLELLANGNVHLENSTLSVDGQTLKYSQSKNTCIVTGTPGMPVHVIQQEFVGGTRREMDAGNVEINLLNSRCRLDDVTISNAF